MTAAALEQSSQGRYQEAELTYQKMIEIGDVLFEEKPAVSLGPRAGLSVLYLEQAQYDKAESLLTNVLQSRRRLLGPERRGYFGLDE